uniref:Uncharacterized protein n=1 Tax=Meloidogyne hapla TaxID=6305 RepID=A0A1I8B130_MELHA
MPCWLQHNKKSLIWRKSKEENLEIPSTSTIDNIQIDNQENEEKSDLGLNELSDYFQHFVCLCSPKMSDLAQSIKILGDRWIRTPLREINSSRKPNTPTTTPLGFRLESKENPVPAFIPEPANTISNRSDPELLENNDLEGSC